MANETQDATGATTLASELASDISPEAMLKTQIETFTNFDRTLVGSGNVKKIMAEIKAKSADLYQVPPEDIVVLEGYNPRVHNRVYYEEIAALAENMAAHGYMKDKPLAVYVTKVDGKDVLALQDGHRRHAAVLQAISKHGAPIKTVPVVVKDRSMDQAALLLDMLHANESSPFTVYEKAILAKRLKSFGWENKAIAKEMRCTPAYVGQLLDLAGAPHAIQQLVQDGQVSATQAFDAIKTHGEGAVQVIQGAVENAKACGKTRATAKDQAPIEDRNVVKARNAKKVALDMYKVLVKISKDEAVMKRLDDKVLTEMDRCIEVVEKVKKVREPKAVKPPKAAKPITVKKTPAAKKKATPKRTPAAKGGAAFFEELSAAQRAAKASRNAA